MILNQNNIYKFITDKVEICAAPILDTTSTTYKQNWIHVNFLFKYNYGADVKYNKDGEGWINLDKIEQVVKTGVIYDQTKDK